MKIYFSGIGGVGIGPLAMIAQDMGHQVLGSDLVESDVSRILVSRGADVSYNQDGAFLRQQHAGTPLDLFVYTSALDADHAELKAASELGVKPVKRHELINMLLKDKGLKLIAVGGTHGKTTTTAMLVWLMQSYGSPIAHSVGTTIKFAPLGRWQEGSEYFIYEADEYDKNFLNFSPFASLITAIDYDHPDTYPTEQEYLAAFKQFAASSSSVIGWSPDLERIGVKPSEQTIGLDPEPYRARPNQLGLKLPGSYNRLNASLVAELASRQLGIDIDRAVSFLNDYPGSARRFEKLAERLYSDYAHHPNEIKATMELAREVTKGKLVVIYQPHQNIRQHQLINSGGYGDCFAGADHVHWLPTYLSREDPSLPTHSPAELMATATAPKDLRAAEMDDHLAARIKEHLASGDTVLAMSAGTLDGWLRQNAVA